MEAPVAPDPNDGWRERSRRAVWHPCTQMKVHETLPPLPVARGAGAKGVEPQVLTDNAKVQVVRWVLQPGERTVIHRHDVDHVGVVLRGSKLRYLEEDGKSSESDEVAGSTEYAPATGRTHSFENAGTTPFEAVSIDLKSCPGK